MVSSSRGAPRRLKLASASPRRRLLLPLLDFPVTVAPSEVDEQPLDGELARDTALRLALAKVRAACVAEAGEAVVGADTIVVLDGKQLGKPSNSGEAQEMLRALRARAHEVITGVALKDSERSFIGAVTTRVRMRRYSDQELEGYIASGRTHDKAGGYAIQDPDFAPVEMVEGCYLNVVGLPLCEVARGLRVLGWPLHEEEYVPPCHWCALGRRALEATP